MRRECTGPPGLGVIRAPWNRRPDGRGYFLPALPGLLAISLERSELRSAKSCQDIPKKKSNFL
jgi:hypothetical protein